MRMETPSVVTTLSGSYADLASRYHGESRDAWHSVMMSFVPGPFMTPKKASKGRAREDLAGRTRLREDRSSASKPGAWFDPRQVGSGQRLQRHA